MVKSQTVAQQSSSPKISLIDTEIWIKAKWHIWKIIYFYNISVKQILRYFYD